MSDNGKVRILVVDDSAFMRKIIADLLGEDPAIEVVGRAKNGKEALKLFQELRPDVVTLDVEMPGMNGIEVLRSIMSQRPTPVLMVSGITKAGADITMQALDAGAVDFVTKPSGTISLDMDKVASELRKKVIAASKAKLQSRPAVRPQHSSPETTIVHAPQISVRREPPKHVELVAIGASTGGPVALQEVITRLPGNFPVPVVLVQHMPPGFTASFAARLNDRSQLNVVEGEDGMQVKKGMVIIAPGGRHMIVEKRNGGMYCKLTDTPPVRSVRPAADVLFKSVADNVGGSVVVAVLTGMGKDGLDGVRSLRGKGAYVIVESKETCVIFGMPGAIVEAGMADEVLPIQSVADGLVRAVKN